MMQTTTAISLAYLRRSRAIFLQMVEELSLDELNALPEGFNNNIIWNMGHILVSTLGLCYIRSQVTPALALPFPGRFAKGTRPTVNATLEEVQEIKKLLVTSLDQIEADIRSGVFENWQTCSTDTYQVPMDSVENTLICCVAHENLHLGIARAQKAVLKQAQSAKTAGKESKVSLN